MKVLVKGLADDSTSFINAFTILEFFVYSLLDSISETGVHCTLHMSSARWFSVFRFSVVQSYFILLR